MPTKYKITKVLGDGRKHPSKYGERIAYPITVVDETGIEEDVDWSRKPNSPAPTVDMMLEADGTYPIPEGAPEGARPRFKGAKVLDKDGNPITRSDSASDGYGGGGGDDPARQARITRSVAQKASVSFVTGMAAAGVAPSSQDMDKWAGLALKYREFFEEDMAELNAEAKKSEEKPATDEPPF